MRRFAVLIAFVFGLVSSFAAPASATATKTTITVTASSGAVAPKVAYTVAGHVVPAAVRPVVLQHLVGKVWKNVATAKSDKRGAFHLAVTPTTAGTWLLRVRTLSGTVALATSRVVTLHVRTASSITGGFTYPTSVQGFAAPLTGVVSPGEAGRAVGLQQLIAGRWTPVASVATTVGGAFAFDAPTTTQGTLSFRVAVAASAARSAAVGAVLTLPVGPKLEGLAVQLSNGLHATVQEFGGAKRTIDMPMADDEVDSAAIDGRIASLAGEQGSPQTLTLTGPSLTPVVLAHVTATNCVYNFELSPAGHAITWTLGVMTQSVCRPTAVYVRDIDAGVTSRLPVDATAIANSLAVQTVFSFDQSYIEVMTTPKIVQVATYTSNALFTLAAVPVRLAGRLDLGEYQLGDAAAPAGYLSAYDIIVGQYVTASLTTGAKPVAVSTLDMWLLLSSRDGTKIAYEVPAADGLHLYTANADFSSPFDLGLVPDDSDTSRTYVSWLGNSAVGIEVRTLANGTWTPQSTVKSATDGTVLLTTPQYLSGWLS